MKTQSGETVKTAAVSLTVAIPHIIKELNVLECGVLAARQSAVGVQRTPKVLNVFGTHDGVVMNVEDARIGAHEHSHRRGALRHLTAGGQPVAGNVSGDDKGLFVRMSGHVVASHHQRGGSPVARLLSLHATYGLRQAQQPVDVQGACLARIDAALRAHDKQTQTVVIDVAAEFHCGAGAQGHDVLARRRDGLLVLADTDGIFVRLVAPAHSDFSQVDVQVRAGQTETIDTDAHVFPLLPAAVAAGSRRSTDRRPILWLLGLLYCDCRLPK